MKALRVGASSVPLREWMAGREPAVPDALLTRLGNGLEVPSEATGTLDTLLHGSRQALQDALAGAGERRGAFRLLAADACLTSACEVALESSEPLASLLRVVEMVAAEAEEG